MQLLQLQQNESRPLGVPQLAAPQQKRKKKTNQEGQAKAKLHIKPNYQK